MWRFCLWIVTIPFSKQLMNLSSLLYSLKCVCKQNLTNKMVFFFSASLLASAGDRVACFISVLLSVLLSTKTLLPKWLHVSRHILIIDHKKLNKINNSDLITASLSADLWSMSAAQRQKAQIVFNHINIGLSSHLTDREWLKSHLIYQHLTFHMKKWVGKVHKTHGNYLNEYFKKNKRCIHVHKLFSKKCWYKLS